MAGLGYNPAMVSLDWLSSSGRCQYFRSWGRQLFAVTLTALAGACEEYTCLDYAACGAPDAGLPGQRDGDGAPDASQADQLSDLPLDAGHVDGSMAGARSSETIVDGAVESTPPTDTVASSDSSQPTSPPADVPASTDIEASSENASIDAGSDPTNADACAAITCGEHAACREDGEGYVCECQRGFIGDGTVCQPVVFDIAAGFEHSCALVGDGRVRCWGDNSAAQGLGAGATDFTGATPASEIPDVDLGEARAESISAGGHTTCVVLLNGQVRCWGGNSHGEVGLVGIDSLGDDEAPNSTAFDVDFGTDLRALQVATGWMHTCALFENGTVRCWGLGQHGQLGNGSTEDWGNTDERSVAKQADVRLNGRAVQVTVGQYHSCALLESGQVVCWGDNQYGQLGLGNTINMGDNETALQAVNLGPDTKAVQIGAGDGFTCALLDAGSVRCWGANYYGQLGLGNTDEASKTTSPSTSAHNVKLGPIDDIDTLSVGGGHSCVVYHAGKLRCWGFGGYGQLGIGNTTWVGASADAIPDSSSYDAVVGDDLQVARVEQYTYHTCAMLTTGAVRCWGRGRNCGYGPEAASTNIGDGTEAFPTPASAGNVPLL